MSRQFLAARPAPKAQRQAAVQTRALAEVAQLAEIDAGFIWGVSGVMVGITLIVSGVGQGGARATGGAQGANASGSCSFY